MSADDTDSDHVIGWKTLQLILDELKERPVKRGSEMDVAGVLSKRMRGANLGK